MFGYIKRKIQEFIVRAVIRDIKDNGEIRWTIKRYCDFNNLRIDKPDTIG